MTDQLGTDGTATDSTEVIFDQYGHVVWTKDASGYISYTGYDPNTGAVVEQIQDVDTDNGSWQYINDTVALPDGWTSLEDTPADALNLITVNVVDSLGRTVISVSPADRVTFTVYDDPNHETRTYTGWLYDGPAPSSESAIDLSNYTTLSHYEQDSSTTLPPVQVTVADLPFADIGDESLEGSATDSLTMTQISIPSPGSSSHTFSEGGVTLPIGGEAIGNAIVGTTVLSLSRSILDNAGQVIEIDDYYDVSTNHSTTDTWAYSTSTLQIGTAWSPSDPSTAANYYVTTYQYSKLGSLDRVEDPNGTINRTVYDSLGRQISTWVGTDDAPDGTTYWQPGSTAETYWNMIETSADVYDNGDVGDSDLTQTTQFVFSVPATWPALGEDLPSETGRVTQMYYDWRDQLVAMKEGVGSSLSAELSDGVNRPLIVDTLDNLGDVIAEAVYTGDGVGISTSTGSVVLTPPSGVTDIDTLLRSYKTFAYDAQGGLQQTIQYSADPTGGIPIADWTDGAPNTSIAKLTTSALYDADGNVAQTTDPNDIVTTYQYNGAGWETQMQQADPITDGSDDTRTTDQLTTSYGYDNDGNLTSETDPLGNVTSYEFDAAERKTEEIDPSPDGDAPDPTILYAYDTAGTLQSETDPKGNATDYAYDALGRETSQTNALTETTSYVYDGDNNVTKTTDPDDQIIANVYNALDQLTQENWYNSSSYETNSINYTYDNLGDMLSAADVSSSYAFTYNVLGQQTSVDNNGSGAGGDTGTAGVPDVVLASNYDALGNRTALDASIVVSDTSTPDFQNSYAYDGFGREASVSQTNGGGYAVANKLVNFSYNADSQLTEIDRYSDLTGSTLVAKSAFGYDSVGRLTSLHQGNSSSTTAYAGDSLTYNADGLLSGVTNSAHTSEDVAYAYDHDAQLTGATYANDTSLNESFAYDANGNPADSGDVITTDSNELASDANWNYSYDADGNLTSQVGQSGGPDAGKEIDYTYDVGNRLTEVKNLTDDTVTQDVKYTYDMFNNVIGRSITVGGTTTDSRFVFDVGTGNMVLAFDGTGAMTDRFLWGPGVNQILADEHFTPTTAGEMPASVGSVYWALANNQGSVTDVVNSSGTLNHTAFDPFGNVISGLSSASVDFLFGQYGEFADSATGKVFAQNRVYDPAIDRWDRPDPTGLRFGPNPYEYVANSPTNLTDPSGLHFFPGLLGWAVTPYYSITTQSGNTYNGSSTSDFFSALTDIGANGDSIDQLILVGHGDEDYIQGPGKLAYLETIGLHINVNTSKNTDEHVQGLLKKITNSKSSISIRSCGTAPLAKKLAEALSNGTTVSGFHGPGLEIPFTVKGIGVWSNYRFVPRQNSPTQNIPRLDTNNNRFYNGN